MTWQSKSSGWLSVLCRFAAAACVLWAAGATSSGAEEAAEWKVGLARADITPEGPIWLAGYAARNKPSEGVLMPLYALALALEDGQGNRAVIVTADVIDFRAEVAQAACEAITAKTGLPRERILLNWSHTHTGPVVNFAERIGYSMPDEQKQVVDAYTRQLVGKYGELAAAALEDLRPAKLSYGVGVAEFPMNRREFTDQGVRIGFNPRGYVDRSVPVLRVDEPDGSLRAVVFGTACHNTTLTGQHYQISGDYAGFARSAIERQLPGVQALFIIGCGADVNPHPRGELEHVNLHGERLAAEVLRVLDGAMRPVRGPLKTAWETVDLPFAPVPNRAELEAMTRGPEYIASNAKPMLRRLDQNEPNAEKYAVPIAVWQFGEDLTLVALPGEVVSDYVPLIENAIGHGRLWIAGYCNEVFGYLPSAKVLSEGGYETRGVYGVGFFAPEVETVVVEAVRRLANQVGRPNLP